MCRWVQTRECCGCYRGKGGADTEVSGKRYTHPRATVSMLRYETSFVFLLVFRVEGIQVLRSYFRSAVAAAGYRPVLAVVAYLQCVRYIIYRSAQMQQFAAHVA